MVDAYLGAHHDAPLTAEEEERALAEAEQQIAREEGLDGDVVDSDSRDRRTDR